MRRQLRFGAAALWLGAAACNGFLGIDEGTPRPAIGAGGSAGEDGSGGASGSGGLGGSGAPKICEPGTEASCYYGPKGTEGIGTCKAGTRTCNGSGTAYTGACLNQVVPWIDMCGDEDCDGVLDPQSAGCTALWFRRISSSGDGTLAVDGTGHVNLAGTLKHSLDCGGVTLVSQGQGDAFSCVLDADDAGHRWSRRMGAAGTDAANAVAVDSLGNWLLTGGFIGEIQLGAQPQSHQQSAGAHDIFIVKYDPNGNDLWAKRFGDGDDEWGGSIAIDGAGNVFVTGVCNGTINFGDAFKLCDYRGIFVVKLAPSGEYVWSKVFKATAQSSAFDIAADSSGNVVLTGELQGSINFGGGMLTSAGNTDIFVVKLNALGEHVWSQLFGDATSQSGESVAVDSVGNVLVTGGFDGYTNFGSGPLVSAGSHDVFVAKLSSSGLHVWSRSFGADDYDWGRDVAVDATGNVLLTGRFQGAVDFGGGPLQSAGGTDIYVAKLTAAGDTVWSRSFGTASSDHAHSIASDGDGNVVIAGEAAGLFVAKLSK